MKRVAQLIRTAGEIRRKIWASLPCEVRFTEVMSRLASQGTDAFGTGIYSIFLQHGVTEGMPDIGGAPAAPGKRLPPSYGREFGRKVFITLMRRHHSPAVVEDLMSGFLVKFMEKADQYIRPGMTRQQAENYVMRSLFNEGISLLRKKKWELNDSTLQREDADGPGFLERSPSPEQEKVISRLLDSPSMRSKLKHIHPSAEQYVRLSLEGYEDVEIIGNPVKEIPSMLDHPTNANGGPLTTPAWTKYKHLIYEALKSGYEEAMSTV